MSAPPARYPPLTSSDAVKPGVPLSATTQVGATIASTPRSDSPDASTKDASTKDANRGRAAVVGVVLKGYPRLSETFIAQELAGLEARGFSLSLISLRHPTDSRVHPVHGRIKAPVTYLPEYLYQEPKRVFRAWRHVRLWPAYSQVIGTWWRDLQRDRSPNRVRRLGQAFVLAYEFRQRVDVLYAHFLHTPASVTRYAAMLLGVPWAVSAHAKDVWTIPDWEKREKLGDCDWLVTCTGVNVEHLRALEVNSDRIHLAYHGLDFEAFGPAPAHDGRVSSATGPVQIVSVGRAVEKKGYDDLLEALARLPSELDWHFRHIGSGELRTSLRAQAKRLGIDSKVTWSGALTQPEVRDALRESDLFVLASRITADGDRDGLPNVLMEACSQGLACVATRVSAIPELIEDGKTGLLVAPRDPPALARAIALLVADEPRRVAIGRAAQAHVLHNFQMDKGLSTIEALLAHSLEGGAGATPVAHPP